ncbi:MAG: hypothetical protein ABW168_10625 [Sedimenticola sp.]
MKPLYLPVSYRFTLAALLVEALILLLLIYLGVQTLNERMGAEAEKDAQSISKILTRSLAEPLVRKDYSQLTDILRASVKSGTIRFAVIYDSRGNSVASESMDTDLVFMNVSHASALEALDLESSYYITHSNIQLAGIQYGSLKTGIPIQFVYKAREALVARYLWVGMILFLLSLAIFLYIGHLFRNNLINIADQIELGHLQERQDEFFHLAQTFNMLIRRELNTQEQLEETVKARTQELESSLNVITETNLELRKAKEATEKASAALNMSELRLKDSQHCQTGTVGVAYRKQQARMVRRGLSDI